MKEKNIKLSNYALFSKMNKQSIDSNLTIIKSEIEPVFSGIRAICSEFIDENHWRSAIAKINENRTSKICKNNSKQRWERKFRIEFKLFADEFHTSNFVKQIASFGRWTTFLHFRSSVSVKEYIFPGLGDERILWSKLPVLGDERLSWMKLLFVHLYLLGNDEATIQLKLAVLSFLILVVIEVFW